MIDNNLISKSVKGLLNEIAEENSNGVMRWHKKLYKIGKPALPLLCKNMLEIHELNLPSKYKHQYIVQLAKVVHDIDEQVCKDITMTLVNAGLDRPTIACLRSLNEFSLDTFLQYNFNGIKIYQQKNLMFKKNIKRAIKKWLSRVYWEDLKDIDRIYILDNIEEDILGDYMAVFNVIRLKWHRFSIATIRKEYTLYHEIGHHVNNHPFEFYDTEHEDKADEYANKMFKRYHTKISRWFINFIKL
jgi:hypothetical protein